MVDEDNAVVHHDADENEQADLGHEVEGRVGDPQEDRHADECKRQREHDGKRMGQALEERGHDEIDHEQGQQHVEEKFLVALILLRHPAVEAPGITHGQRHAVHDVGDQPAALVAVFQAADHPDVGARAAVLPLDGLGGLDDFEVGHVRQENVPAVGAAAYDHALEVFDVLPVLLPKLDPDLHLPIG